MLLYNRTLQFYLNSLYGKTVFAWEFATLDGQQVTSSSGLPVMPNGKLADIAPTILELMSIKLPSSMNGQSLLKR